MSVDGSFTHSQFSSVICMNAPHTIIVGFEAVPVMTSWSGTGSIIRDFLKDLQDFYLCKYTTVFVRFKQPKTLYERKTRDN